MAFFFLCVTIFIMFFQPAAVFPMLERYQPLRNSALIAFVAYLLSKKQGTPNFFKERVNIFFFLFILFQTASSFVLWFWAGVETFNLWLRMGLVYYLVTKSVTSTKRLIWLVMMIITGISYLSYYSISTFIVKYMPGVRAGGFGWYEGSNDIAIILVASIPLVLILVNSTKRFILKYLFLSIAAMFAFNILFTGSRNGLLGLLVVGVLSMLLSKRFSHPIRFVIIVILIVFVFTTGLTNVLYREDLQGLSGDASSENRLEQWKAGLRMVKHNPFFGVGREEFTTYVEQYGGIKGLLPHNTLIQVFAESGIPAGICFCLFSFMPFINIRKIFKRKNEYGKESLDLYYLFVAVSLAGFWVCAFFSNRYQFYILYVLVALAVSIQNNLINRVGNAT